MTRKASRIDKRFTIDDPFKFFAQNLSDGTHESDFSFDEEPVLIDEFVESKHFLNQKWNGRRGCRPKVLEILHDLSQEHIREAMVIIGKGSFMSHMAVTLSDGSSKEIGFLYRQFQKNKKLIEIINFDLNTNKQVISSAIPRYSGKKKFFRVTTSHGDILDVTSGHNMLTFFGKKRMDELQVGDDLCIAKDFKETKSNFVFDKSEKLPKKLSHKIKKIVLKAGMSLTQYRKKITMGKQIPIDKIDFLKSYLDMPNKEFSKGCVHYTEIVSIEEIPGFHKGYDITVICGENNQYRNYCCSGVFVSNSGKDYLTAILHLYGIHRCLCMTNPQAYYGLSTGSPIYFVNTARNEKQAKMVFFREFKGLLLDCPWFHKKFSDPGVQDVTFDKGICALSANSQAYAWLGYNTLQWVGDEIAFFLENDSDENSLSRSHECWEATYGSCQTRFPDHYKMIGITTPRIEDDFVMTKYYELKEREDGYTRQAATWEIHPNLTIKDFRYALERDYRRAMRDFGARPTGVQEGFWSDHKFIEKNVCEICKNCPVYKDREGKSDLYRCFEYEGCKANAYMGNGHWREWFKTEVDSEAEYNMHFDLSKNKDRVGFTLTHSVGDTRIQIDPWSLVDRAKREKVDVSEFDEDDKYENRPVIKIDAIGWISNVPSRNARLLKNGEFHYDSILKLLIYQLKDYGCNVVKVTVDQYNSIHFKQSLEDRGYETELVSLDRTDEVPVAAKNAFVEGRVQYPYDKLFCTEAKNLKYINGKKVDHVNKQSKDVWDSAAGAVYVCESDFQQGCFEIFDYDEGD